MTDNPNTGHGHVRPRPDGVKARCGGPGLCSVCSREAATKAVEDRAREAAAKYVVGLHTIVLNVRRVIHRDYCPPMPLRERLMYSTSPLAHGRFPA